MKKIYTLLFLVVSLKLGAQSDPLIMPVTPDPSPESIELLNYLYSISGEKTLSGQHDQPIFGSAYYNLVYEKVGEHPAVKGMDFGFSEAHTLDGINFRQHTVDEAIRYHRQGSIITLMWHAVPPNMEEPVTFKGGIQSKLNKKEWEELMTPGSPMHLRWQSQVDVIAFFLRQLREANVPVIWRPYHEMNGAWFWWGKKPGEDGYKKLYRMLFERLVHYHNLNNLIWVYNTNEIRGDHIAPHADFYPGHEYVDILATDVYSARYRQSDYDSLRELADGKLIALGEVGKMPTPEILNEQPEWVWFMTWVDFVFRSNSHEELMRLYQSERVLNREDIPD